MKYVRLANGEFVLFPDSMIHADVVESLSAKTARSAGSVEFDAHGVPRCIGMSNSLKLKANKDDSADLAKEMGVAPPAKMREVEMLLVLMMKSVIDKYGRDAVGVVMREMAHNLLTKPDGRG